jgi:hypothetical protein
MGLSGRLRLNSTYSQMMSSDQGDATRVAVSNIGDHRVGDRR